VDLALDLWVTPDRQQVVLDEDEFAALDLDPDTRSRAQKGWKSYACAFVDKESRNLVSSRNRVSC
jgi:predicted RNA-binding protein associated with RNAse of E/G family